MAAQKLSWQPDMRNVRGRLLEKEPMSRHTSWRLGGPADWYFVPADLKDLQQFIGELPGDMPIYWIGLGSNLLVRDAGIRGVVIGTHKGLAAIQQVDGQLVRAEAGVASAQVARFCGRQHMMGAEFLAGIPGSFGGALAMNAGAFGGETWDIVDSVEVIDRKGTVVTRKADEFSPAYRHIDIEASNWFVAATIRLRSGDSSQSKSEILSLLKRRGDSQPVQSANAGSVFRNPPGDHAARRRDQQAARAARGVEHARRVVRRVTRRCAALRRHEAALEQRGAQALGRVVGARGPSTATVRAPPELAVRAHDSH